MSIKLGAVLAIASMTLMGLVACSGTGFPVSLSGSGSNSGSGTGSGSSGSGSVTTGSGTTACTAGLTMTKDSSFQECANLPVNNGTYIGSVPLSILATSQYGMSGWHLYVDNVGPVDSDVSTQPTYGTTSSSWIGTISGLSPGTHTIGVNVWDNDSSAGWPANAYTVTVNVVASPFPTPGANAAVYSNLQAATGSDGTWTICNASCSGSSGSTGSSTITLNATNAPSLSGAALEETSTGTAFNTLGYLKPPCPTAGCTSVTNFLDDVWFYIPAATNQLQALEFDPDVYDGSYEYFMSMQCDSASGDWRFWDMAGGQWTTQGGSTQVATYPCTLLTQTNTWHHFQLYGTMNYTAHTYTYQTLAVDGAVVYQNLGNAYSAKSYKSSSQAINVEQQIDNNASATSNSVYYDNYTLTVW